MTTKNWWDVIFDGHLKIGINEEKIQQLEDESFLYFHEGQTDQEQTSQQAF